MKNLSQTTAESRNSVIPIIKGIGIAFFITLLLLFLFSIVLTYTNISESTTAPVILVITAISILIGSSIGSSKIRKNGLINGGIVGFSYIMFLYIISSFTRCRLFAKFIFYFNDNIFYCSGNSAEELLV